MLSTFSREIGANELHLESGKLALQTNGSVVLRYGDCVLLATATMSKPREGGATKMKRAFAEELVRQTAPDGGLGATLGRILVGNRNAAAMRVFQKELTRGRKRIGIFYGGAHMPDFERRLIGDFGMKKDTAKPNTKPGSETTQAGSPPA